MNKYLASLIATLGFLATPALAETTECTEITTIPIIITAQGVYCLKGNLLTSLTSGNAIDIQTNNVTIDFNGFKLGGLAAGAATAAFGVYAVDRKNIVLRNGSIRGFYYGIYLVLSGGTSSGHLLEDLILDGNRQIGAAVEGTGMVVRNNRIVNTGPGDTTTVAYGLLMQYSANSQIVGNFISNTTETNGALGIYVNSSSLIEVRGNTVLDTDGGTFDRVYISITAPTVRSSTTGC